MSKTFANRVNLIRTQKTKQYGIITLDLTIARINEEIGIQGNMIYTETLSLEATAYLRLNEISADPILMKMFRKINGCFYRVFITHNAQPGKTITFYFSTSENELHNDFSIEDYYLAVGSRLALVDCLSLVNNITQDDSEFFETKAKKAFIGSTHLIATAAKYNATQLWNPVASGVNGLLECINYKTGILPVGIIPLCIGYWTAAYTLTDQYIKANKYLGETTSLIQIRHETSSTPPLMYSMGYLPFVEAYGSGTVNYITFKKPILIPPGKGLVISMPPVVNLYLDVNFQWYEKAI